MKKFDLPLVNAHSHSAMIAFRGMAEDLLLDKWLNDYIWPMEKELVNEDFVYQNTLLAIKEMQKNGIRLINDMYFYPDFAAKAAIELEMNYILGAPIINFPMPGCSGALDGLIQTEDLLIEYSGNDLIKVVVIPHAIYTTTDEILIKSKNLAKKYNTQLHIHVAETKKEFDDCIVQHGVSPVKYLYNLGILDSKTIMAHCVWLTDEDIEIISETGAHVIHCPLSNLKLGSGIAPITKLLAKGVNVCLGTDGAASSNRLDIWEAGKITGLLQKGITNNPTVLPTKQIIKMMTINGMKALGYDKLDGKNLKDIEEIIESEDNYNYLYELNVGEIF